MMHHAIGGLEGRMARRQLKEICEMADELYCCLDDHDDIHEWVQVKLATIHDRLQSVHSYMSYEMKYPRDDFKLGKYAAAQEHGGIRVKRKLYRPKVQTFMYDDKGRILAAKSQGAGSGLRAYNNYKFPGGGVEPGESITEAARKELLEEAGYEPGGEMFEFGEPTPVDWDKKFRAQARKKGRGQYAGQYEYYAAGPLGKRNKELLGVEGDQMSDLEMVPISRLERDLRRTANDPNNEYGYFDKQKLVALAALREEMEQRGIKTASVEYRGQTFPGYNQPIRNTDGGQHKMKVLAKKGDEIKLVRFGHRGYKHNYSNDAKRNYLTRSAGIRDKNGNLTMNDKFSPNYWSRKVLWPARQEADGKAALRRRRER